MNFCRVSSLILSIWELVEGCRPAAVTEDAQIESLNHVCINSFNFCFIKFPSGLIFQWIFFRDILLSLEVA